MKALSIKIKNFKGFEMEEFNFDPHFTVFIGKNGTGKSSVLDALAFSLGTYFLGVDGVVAPSLKNEQKRRKYVSPNSVEVQLPLKIDIWTEFEDKNIHWFRDTNKKNGGSTSYKSANPLIKIAKEKSKKVRLGEEVQLPLLAYYGTERLSSERSERKAYMKKSSRLDGYSGCFDPRSVKKKFLNWFKTIEASKLQQFQENEAEQDNSLYDAFVQTISVMLPGWTDIHFNLKNDDMMGKTANGTWEQFHTLSDGYKNVIRLSADIAFRAIKLNPHLGINAVRETKGVVIIDELDMHLHPSWQRTIVSDLKEAFPNIQFITTTHSPFIVQSLESHEVINLDENELSEDPNRLSLQENALYMGVENVFGESFVEEETISYNFLTLLNEEKSDEKLIQLKSLLEKTTDPVMKAKLRMELLSKYGLE